MIAVPAQMVGIKLHSCCKQLSSTTLPSKRPTPISDQWMTYPQRLNSSLLLPSQLLGLHAGEAQHTRFLQCAPSASALSRQLEHCFHLTLLAFFLN